MMICVKCKAKTAGTANPDTGIRVPLCTMCRPPGRGKNACRCGREKMAKSETCIQCSWIERADLLQRVRSLENGIDRWLGFRAGPLSPREGAFVAKMNALIETWRGVQARIQRGDSCQVNDADRAEQAGKETT